MFLSTNSKTRYNFRFLLKNSSSWTMFSWRSERNTRSSRIVVRFTSSFSSESLNFLIATISPVSKRSFWILKMDSSEIFYMHILSAQWNERWMGRVSQPITSFYFLRENISYGSPNQEHCGRHSQSSHAENKLFFSIIKLQLRKFKQR